MGLRFFDAVSIGKTILTSFSIVLFSGVLSLPAGADGGAAASVDSAVAGKDSAQASTPTSAQAAAAKSSAQTLSGGVQHSVKDAQLAIKDLGDTARQLKDNAWYAFCEVQQQDEVYVGGPNLVGGMVIPAVGGSGFLSTGEFRPPRPKWLNYFIQNVDYMSRQLDVEIANTQMPDDLSDNGKQSFARMMEIARAVPAKVMNLEGAAKPPYKNMPIAVAAQEVLDDLKEFEKAQKVVARELKNLARKSNRK